MKIPATDVSLMMLDEALPFSFHSPFFFFWLRFDTKSSVLFLCSGHKGFFGFLSDGISVSLVFCDFSPAESAPCD